jgi:hypothetical protein
MDEILVEVRGDVDRSRAQSQPRLDVITCRYLSDIARTWHFTRHFHRRYMLVNSIRVFCDQKCTTCKLPDDI